MVICDFGDIAVVPFPFTDVPVSKRRPALALSAREFNTQNGHTIFAMITTAARSRWPQDMEISMSPETGLVHASVVRWKLFTLPNNIILSKAGVLGQADLATASSALQQIFGLQSQIRH